MVFGRDPLAGRVPWREALWLLPPPGRRLAEELAARIEGPEETGITGFELRLEHGTGRGHVTLSVPREPAEKINFDTDLPARWTSTIDGLIGVAVPSRAIEAGASFLRHELPGGVLESHYAAFFQANCRLLPLLLEAVLEDVEGQSAFLDLYCGVGLYSLLAAARSRAGTSLEILGIDSNPQAIESARRNAARLGLSRARFQKASVEDLPGVASQEPPFHVFVNPSRFGCPAGLSEALIGLGAESATLVSCSIESHVRDVGAFVRAGWHPDSIRSFDMFPFSRFVESVTILRRRVGHRALTSR
jgi:hypothetical protein